VTDGAVNFVVMEFGFSISPSLVDQMTLTIELLLSFVKTEIVDELISTIYSGADRPVISISFFILSFILSMTLSTSPPHPLKRTKKDRREGINSGNSGISTPRFKVFANKLKQILFQI
jgi:hypothetical protein